MINNELNLEPWRAVYRRERRVQVPDFLQADAASRILQCLRHEVPWTLAEHIDGDSSTIGNERYAAMPAAEQAQRLQAAYRRAEQGFQYAYDSYPMVEAAKEGRDPGLLLHAVLQFLNTPQFLSFVHWFTGEPGINLVTAQATRYRRGHFLTEHDDQEVHEGRICAYVINLTPRWRVDWGGLLQFIGPDQQALGSYLPRYNSLSLFRVPQAHCVGLVSPWAGEDRLAITGWFLQRSR